MIRVLIVEDSVTQREIFCRLLADDPELTVVASARDGHEAIEQVRVCAPDVVLMDIHMPGMDGIAATTEIMQRSPVPIVIASATLKKRDVDLAMKAYEAGAVAVIEKPAGAVLLHLRKIADDLRRELIAASRARVGQAPAARAANSSAKRSAAPPAATRGTRPSPFEVVGICASTGGPPALLKILKQLPRPFPRPILFVQHISRGFEDGFVKWLATMTGHSIDIAADRQRLTPGIWMAPAGRHLTLRSQNRVELIPGTAGEIHCPSGNRLFASLARCYGPRALGIQLTGMGDDGAEGLLALKQAGGATIVQDEASCMIWGMPKAAIQLGAANRELDLDGIARALTDMTQADAAQGPLPSEK